MGQSPEKVTSSFPFVLYLKKIIIFFFKLRVWKWLPLISLASFKSDARLNTGSSVSYKLDWDSSDICQKKPRSNFKTRMKDITLLRLHCKYEIIIIQDQIYISYKLAHVSQNSAIFKSAKKRPHGHESFTDLIGKVQTVNSNPNFWARRAFVRGYREL